MAAVGRLAVGVAEEIGDPIARIKSNLGVLECYVEELLDLVDVYERADKELPLDSPLSRAVKAAKAKADIDFLKSDLDALFQQSRTGVIRVSRIVQCLKHFAPDEMGIRQMADVHQEIDNSLKLVWHELQPKAELVKDYGRLPSLECRPEQLKQVFMNLVLNAAQAIEQSGVITIRTHADDRHVRIEISDNGRGIAAEDQARIFEPFYSTKPVGVATGLGLYTAYGIVSKYDGTIEVCSEKGQGSTFSVVLPHHRDEG
jgi:signal transduction histidine kinase